MCDAETFRVATLLIYRLTYDLYQHEQRSLNPSAYQRGAHVIHAQPSPYVHSYVRT